MDFGVNSRYASGNMFSLLRCDDDGEVSSVNSSGAVVSASSGSSRDVGSMDSAGSSGPAIEQEQVAKGKYLEKDWCNILAVARPMHSAREILSSSDRVAQVADKNFSVRLTRPRRRLLHRMVSAHDAVAEMAADRKTRAIKQEFASLNRRRGELGAVVAEPALSKELLRKYKAIYDRMVANLARLEAAIKKPKKGRARRGRRGGRRHRRRHTTVATGGRSVRPLALGPRAESPVRASTSEAVAAASAGIVRLMTEGDTPLPASSLPGAGRGVSGELITGTTSAAEWTAPGLPGAWFASGTIWDPNYAPLDGWGAFHGDSSADPSSKDSYL